jgi:DNA-binding winged helix-turn-helix (wHTH) protein
MFDGPPTTETGLLPCGAFRLDLARGRLVDGAGRPVALRPKSVALLEALLRRQGVVVAVGALLDEVWGDAAVTPDSVTQCVIEIRRALGQRAGLVLRTLRGRGYVLEPDAMAPAGQPRPSLVVLPFAGHEGRRAGRIGAALAEELAIELLHGGGIDLRAPWPPRSPMASDYLLEGGVRVSGGWLRVSARLVASASAALVWGDRFVARTGGLHRAQDQVMREMAAKLRALLSPEAPQARAAASGWPSVTAA